MLLTAKLFLPALLILSLGGCTTLPLSDGRPAPPNYYIHRLGLEGGGG